MCSHCTAVRDELKTRLSTSLLCFGTAVVEQAADVRTGVAHQLPQKTQDSPVQSSPGLYIATPSHPLLILCCMSLHLMYALFLCCT